MNIIQWIINHLDLPMIIIYFYAIISFFAFFWYLIKGIFKHDNSDMKELLESISNMYKKKPLLFNIVFILIITCVLVSSHEIKYAIGKNSIKSIPDGTYFYYVKEKKVGLTKEYTIPASITKKTTCSFTSCNSSYYINKAYFAENKYLTFEYDNEVKIDKSIVLLDIHDTEFEITLFDKKAHMNGFSEDVPTAFNYGLLIILMITIITTWLSAIWYVGRKDNQNKKLEELYKELMLIRLKYLVSNKKDEYLKAAQKLISERITKLSKNYFVEDMECPMNSRKKYKETVDKYDLQLVAASKEGIVFTGNPDYAFFEDLVYFENALADVLNWSYFSHCIVAVISIKEWDKYNTKAKTKEIDETKEDVIISKINKIEKSI